MGHGEISFILHLVAYLKASSVAAALNTITEVAPSSVSNCYYKSPCLTLQLQGAITRK